MVRLWRLLLLILVLSHSTEEPFNEMALGSTENQITTALKALRGTSSGLSLLKKASEAWKISDSKELLAVFEWGDASRTDAVLTRHYNATTGEEIRERRVMIYLRRNQSFEDLVLDMAHELVHATARPSWDPYDPKLTPGKYIWAAIEADGGEVDALVAECRVGTELWRRNSPITPLPAALERCKGYWSGNTIDREKVKSDFYRVGKWYPAMKEKLGKESFLFPLLTDHRPKLYSSTGHAPYPVALYEEFSEITQIACENTRRRLKSAKGPGRAPASPSVFLVQRCPQAQR